MVIFIMRSSQNFTRKRAETEKNNRHRGQGTISFLLSSFLFLFLVLSRQEGKGGDPQESQLIIVLENLVRVANKITRFGSHSKFPSVDKRGVKV